MNDEKFMEKLNALSNENTQNTQNRDLDTSNFLTADQLQNSSSSKNKSCACNGSKNINNKNLFTDKIKDLFDSFMNIFKNIAGERDIYKAISIYEFYLSIILLLLILSTQNTYLGLLLLGLYSRQIPEIFIKVFVSKSKGELIKWAKRPDNAKDCNMFNSGGDASNDSGLVSSHTFLISTLMFYFIYRFTNNLKESMNYKQIILIVILLLWTLIVALARVRLGCHNKNQTILGIILGVIWGYIIYIIIESIKNKVPRIAIDEDKVIRIFDINN